MTTTNSYVFLDDQSTTCNCACSVCLSGGCCLLKTTTWPAWTWIGTDIGTDVSLATSCGAVDHNFIVLDPKKRLVVCSKCGTSRTV